MPDSVSPEVPYSVPEQSRALLWDGILNNPLHTSFPEDLKDAAAQIEYKGTTAPTMHIPWRFAESISALKGLQAAMLNVLLKRKYGLEYQKIVIDTDHAQLFVLSVIFPIIDPDGAKVKVAQDESYYRYFPDLNFHNHRLISPCTNIYKTKDNKFYHIHGSVNHHPGMQALGLTDEDEFAPPAQGNARYAAKVAEYTAKDLDALWNDKIRQAGTICQSKDEFLASENAKANAHVGLYEIHSIPNSTQPASWWRASEQTGPRRPLAGLKVIDLTRMIAAPTVCRELAELGASVLRITSPNIPDLSHINLDVNWGKWNAHLDLTKEEDGKTLKELIDDCDVVVDGYRPGVMEKWGFGKNDILKMFEGKERGIIYAHENCYGWNGPLTHRSGWQQVSDAHCGTSYEFGRAMGNDEPVTPVWPNSDYCTGVAGATAILDALIKKAEHGGSYVVDIALNYYSRWLITSVGMYPPDVWDELWSRYGRPVYRHYESMAITMPAYLSALMTAKAPMLSPAFFEDRENKALGCKIRVVKPILVFPEGVVQPGYNVGSRPNGVDKAKWPQDLLVEIVA